MELNFSELGLERFLTQAYSQALVEGELPLPDGRKGAAVLAYFLLFFALFLCH